MPRALLVPGLLFLGAVLGPAARAEDPPAEDVYVRLAGDVGGVVLWLDEEADRIDARQVLVVLDAPTFAPPPEANEFTVPDTMAGDLPAWIETFDRWADTTPRPIRGTTTIAPHSVRLGEDGAVAAWRASAERAWWDDPNLRRLDPAWRWLTRLLKRNRSSPLLEDATGPRMLILVTGRMPPEQWVTPGAGTVPAAWRSKLLDVGDYWDTEAIGQLLQGQGVRLYVVGAETFFGQELPYAELPVFPWAARPRRLPPALLTASAQFQWLVWGGRLPTGGVAPIATLPRPPPGSPAGLRDAWRTFLRRRRSQPTFDAAMVPSHLSPARFLGAPSAFFDAVQAQIPIHDHTPSGFGWWPYARTAEKTGGRYVLLPARTEALRDTAPRDPALMARLAPELVGGRAYASLRKGDAALHLLSRVGAELAETTPWADPGTASAWSAYLRAAPSLARSTDWEPFRAPFGLFDAPTRRDAVRHARRLRDEGLPGHDDAFQRLGALLARIEAGEEPGVPRRGIANLRLARFLVAQSAFHLQSWVDGVLARETGAASIPFEIRLLPVLRLSDCLPAYDGRVLPLERETNYDRWEPDGMFDDYPGSLLRIPGEHPDFRARRSLARVLGRFDDPLRRRALVMVHAAEDVMTHLAETPWGASVYYSEAYWFEVSAIE